MHWITTINVKNFRVRLTAPPHPQTGLTVLASLPRNNSFSHFAYLSKNRAPSPRAPPLGEILHTPLQWIHFCDWLQGTSPPGQVHERKYVMCIMFMCALDRCACDISEIKGTRIQITRASRFCHFRLDFLNGIVNEIYQIEALWTGEHVRSWQPYWNGHHYNKP